MKKNSSNNEGGIWWSMKKNSSAVEKDEWQDMDKNWSKEKRDEWRRRIFEEAVVMGHTQTGIANEIGCTQVAIGHVLDRGARYSKVARDLDEWLKEHVETLMLENLQTPDDRYKELIKDLRQTFEMLENVKELSLKNRVDTLLDTLLRVQKSTQRLRRSVLDNLVDSSLNKRSTVPPPCKDCGDP